MARVTTKTIMKPLAEKLIAVRNERLLYEENHALESTINMGLNATRNTIAIFDNIAMIGRNKSEIKVVESLGELEQAYANLIA